MLLVLSVALLVASAPTQVLGQANDPTVRIVSPSDGAVVPAETKFRLKMQITPDDFGGHVHVYVDGRLRKMVFSESTRLRLQPGRHAVKVELVDNGHHRLGATDTITVRAR
jgi:hypothetical protein